MQDLDQIDKQYFHRTLIAAVAVLFLMSVADHVIARPFLEGFFGSLD